ncbi:MAG TPA: ABC transporter substrate-binding protein [Flavobacteriaceae bacterium]|nr:ABC transporter substrate-binding protein [Flavobacteriaceae bacterium]
MKQIPLLSFLFSLFFLIGITSCKKETNSSGKEKFPLVSNTSNIKYATGFEIEQHKGYKKLIIKSPYPKAEKSLIYVLLEDKNILAHTDFHNVKIIPIPIKKLVVTSTTHIPMLELLNQEQTLVGFPNTKYISSPKTRSLIKNGAVKELGKEQNINTELLLDLQPDLVIGFSLNSNNKMFTNIEKAGIPVILNGDWLEKTPLGRAEWIKFFGVLFNKEKQADSLFNHIEKEYLQAKKIALKAINKPKILSGAMYQDKWNLPAGDSYAAQFLKDANVNYPWLNSKGKGSLSLSFESVFDKAKDAQIWLSPSFFNSYKQLSESSIHYTQFDAFKSKKVYNFVNKKGETGGVLYYELAPIQPHIVLKDIIKIVHPELLKNYTPIYLEELN